MTSEELQKIVIEYIDSFNTMTLSCSHGDEPWSAPVYYARQNFDLIFFSSSNSQHSQAFEQNPKAAVSIYGHYDRWQDIKGLQINGQVHSIKNLASLTVALKTYLKRFPFATDFFSNAGFISDILTKRTRITIYIFKSEAIYYLDNSKGFGTRWRIDIHEKGPKPFNPDLEFS